MKIRNTRRVRKLHRPEPVAIPLDPTYGFFDSEDISLFHDADEDDAEIIALLTQLDSRTRNSRHV